MGINIYIFSLLEIFPELYGLCFMVVRKCCIYNNHITNILLPQIRNMLNTVMARDHN